MAENSSLDTITLSVTDTIDISATHAELFIQIQGSSFFGGSMALTRAHEVAQFVAQMKELGLTDDDIQLERVSVSQSANMITRSSSALYELKAHCEPLDRLAELLGAISAQKNIQLLRTVWGYKNRKDAQDTLLDRCLAELTRKAERVAQGLGVTVLGVHRFRDQRTSPETTFTPAPQEELMMVRSGSPAPVDLGMQVGHKAQLHLTVEAEFRVSRFAS